MHAKNNRKKKTRLCEIRGPAQRRQAFCRLVRDTTVDLDQLLAEEGISPALLARWLARIDFRRQIADSLRQRKRMEHLRSELRLCAVKAQIYHIAMGKVRGSNLARLACGNYCGITRKRKRPRDAASRAGSARRLVHSSVSDARAAELLRTMNRAG